MPSFKPKNSKKYKCAKKVSVTLDGKHREILAELQRNREEVIPALKLEKRRLIHQLQRLPSSSMALEDRLDAEDRVRELTRDIGNLVRRERAYFVDNARYIFDYFEQKKNLTNGIKVATANTATTTKNQRIQSLFKVASSSPSPSSSSKSSVFSPTANGGGAAAAAADGDRLGTEEGVAAAHHGHGLSHGGHNVVQKYLSNVDDGSLDLQGFTYAADQCEFCGVGEWTVLEDEGLQICGHCAHSAPYLIENEKPSYKEPPKEVCFYAYKRINHFKEIIAQFQGKETTQIPAEVIETIKHQIRKERINLEQMTHEQSREILKKLGYARYYEHLPFIKHKLGIPPPIMSPELEETLFSLFAELQSPYSRHCPDNRTNFLHYCYTLYKLCELLGETRYLPHIQLLKDREKIMEQDCVWKQICRDLNWEFIHTI